MPTYARITLLRLFFGSAQRNACLLSCSPLALIFIIHRAAFVNIVNIGGARLPRTPLSSRNIDIALIINGMTQRTLL